jgi:hypothetical protein
MLHQTNKGGMYNVPVRRYKNGQENILPHERQGSAEESL